MRLTWRDGLTTLLAALVGAIALAVHGSWGWPLLGSTRAGVAAIGAIGLGMCIVGGSSPEASFEGRFAIVASTMGILASVLIVVGLITGIEGVLLALVIDIALLWLASTIHHASAKEGVHAGGPAYA